MKFYCKQVFIFNPLQLIKKFRIIIYALFTLFIQTWNTSTGIAFIPPEIPYCNTKNRMRKKVQRQGSSRWCMCKNSVHPLPENVMMIASFQERTELFKKDETPRYVCFLNINGIIYKRVIFLNCSLKSMIKVMI